MSTAQDLSFVDHFLGKIENVTTVKGLHQELETATYDLGFAYFALIQHVHPKGWPQPIIHLHNYPKGWVDAYDEQHLFRDDPVLQACRNSNVGFAWEDLAAFCNPNAEHRKILTISAASGLGTGYTVPANIPGELPGSCSFVTKLGQKLPRHNLLAAQLIGAFAYGQSRTRRVDPAPT
jgi:LuxR family transcriptional regulator, quorum-sensing system regulator CciR